MMTNHNNPPVSSRLEQLPEYNRFLEVVSGYSQWSPQEVESFQDEPWFALRQAEACLELAQIADDPSRRETLIRDAVKHLRNLPAEPYIDAGTEFLVAEFDGPVAERLVQLLEKVETRSSPDPQRENRTNRNRLLPLAACAVILVTVCGALALMRSNTDKENYASEILGKLVIASVGGKTIESDVVNSGDQFTFEIEAKTHYRRGWLFMIDDEAAVLRAKSENDNGQIRLRFENEFDTRECVEHFVVILADNDAQELDGENVASLLRTRLDALQRLDVNSRGTAQAATLIKSEMSTIMGSHKYEVFVWRFQHHYEQR